MGIEWRGERKTRNGKEKEEDGGRTSECICVTSRQSEDVRVDVVLMTIVEIEEIWRLIINEREREREKTKKKQQASSVEERCLGRKDFSCRR